MSAILMGVVSIVIALNAQDVWDGTSVNTDWYSIGQTEYHLYTAADLSGLANLVNQGVTFEGCDVYLEEDIDLNNRQWIPIGPCDRLRFAGTFDGNGHKINNFYINTGNLIQSYYWDTYWYSIGLFGYANRIANLNLQGQIDIKDLDYIAIPYIIGGLSGYANHVERCVCDISIYNYVIGWGKAPDIGLAVGTTIGEILKTKVSGKYIAAIGESGTVPYPFDGSLGAVAGHCGGKIKECSSDANISVAFEKGINNNAVGGIVGESAELEDVIFKGRLIINLDDNDNYLLAGGIAGYCSYAKNLIFAPTEARLTTSCFQYLAGTVTSNFAFPNVNNSYYDNEFELNDNGIGIGVSKEDLTSGIPLDSSFSSDIWEFTPGKLPQLKALKSKCGIYFTSDNGNVGILFDEGESCTVSLKPAFGWKISGLYANGEDCTYAISNNTYSIDNISTDIYLDIIYEQTGSSVQSMSKGKDCDIKITDGTLVLTTEEGIPVNVYDLNGILVYSAKCHGTLSTKLEKGGYVVTVGDRSYKVMMH